MNESTFFFKGDLAKYTGKTQELYGQTWFEAEIQEGHREGELILTPNPPERETRLCFL